MLVICSQVPSGYLAWTLYFFLILLFVASGVGSAFRFCPTCIQHSNRSTSGLLWSPYVIRQTIIFCAVISIFLFFSPNLSGCLPYFHTWCGLSANLECRQVWNLLHAAGWKHRTQKSRQKSPSGHLRTTLSGYIFTTKAHIDNRKKNLLSSNMFSTCPHNMVNFGTLAAEIDPVDWGTPANFNRFRVLVALLHDIYSSGRQPNFAALNRGRHLCAAGRPSRWALAHILVYLFIYAPFSGTHPQVRGVDGFSRTMAKTTRTRTRLCLFGFHWYGSQFRAHISQNSNFCGVNRRFQAKLAKSKKCILSKLLHRFQPNMNSDKYNQMPFVNDPNTRITNPRRPPSWKKSKNRHI